MRGNSIKTLDIYIDDLYYVCTIVLWCVPDRLRIQIYDYLTAWYNMCSNTIGVREAMFRNNIKHYLSE